MYVCMHISNHILIYDKRVYILICSIVYISILLFDMCTNLYTLYMYYTHIIIRITYTSTYIPSRYLIARTSLECYEKCLQ